MVAKDTVNSPAEIRVGVEAAVELGSDAGKRTNTVTMDTVGREFQNQAGVMEEVGQKEEEGE